VVGSDFIIIGAGFYGSVLAERIATVLGKRVTLVDRRPHLGGNSASAIDSATGIECHTYGSHIFHTSKENVWKYVCSFTHFNSYQHKVFARYNGKVYTLPINLKTINDYFGVTLAPGDVPQFLRDEIAKGGIAAPRNLEEKAISLVGRSLYEAFIKGYTFKQWNKDPRELPESIIMRLPVRANYNNNYFNDPYQGIPTEGYGSVFERMLRHPNIDLRLKTTLNEIRHEIPETATVIYTGMIDELFDYALGVLEWRSLDFSWETHPVADYQGTSVMNYSDGDIPYTRIHEFKHYHPERRAVFESPATIVCKEFSSDYGIGKEAYYPVNTARNTALYATYMDLFKSRYPRWRIGGRLGAYQYWDMDKTIEQALLEFDTMIKETGR